MTRLARPSLEKKLGAKGVVLALGLLVSSGLSLGCTKLVQGPPETAPKHARHDAPEKPTPATEDYPEHIAPPPAYGNKVVMAHNEPVADTY